MNTYKFNSLEYKEFIAEIDKLTSILNSGLIISEEGFGSIAKKVLFGIIDGITKRFISVGQNSISLFNIAGIFNSIIRNSPLEDYYHQNLSKVFLAVKSNNPLINKVVVYKPRGMNTTYNNVLNINEHILKTINIVPFIKSVNNEIDIIIDLLKKDKTTIDNFSGKVFDITKLATSNIKLLTSLSEEHDKQFNGDETKENKTTLDKEFKDIKGFKNYCDETINLFKEIRNIKEVDKIQDKQSMIIRNMVDLIEKREDLLNKENVTLLVDYLKYIAACYQLFGAVALTQIAIENNLIITLKEVVNTFMK